jgi:hypothetical protein
MKLITNPCSLPDGTGGAGVEAAGPAASAREIFTLGNQRRAAQGAAQARGGRQALGLNCRA